jgi:hypothetical protein
LYHLIIRKILQIFNIDIIIGNTTNITTDKVRELVFFEPEKNLKILSSVFINGFDIENDKTSFIFKDNIEDINNYLLYIDNSYKYNNSQIDKIEINIYNLLYDKIKKRFIDINYNYDIYTSPNIINIEEYYNNINNYKNIFGGSFDYKYKYNKYKYKYLNLKLKLK